MSKVDDRIVEMKFENQGFEKNIDSSISALERLKSALNFNGAEKSIANVEKSVNNVDFSRLSASVDALSSRFSAWGVAGMTVIQDLTHAAERLGMSLFNATIGQVKAGGWRRATNIDQAKFMLKGLDIEWNDIKDDIDYGVVDTAYGMDAAARAASQLVASGVQLGEEMKASLRAISGVAAMTNSSYEEISPIFTTIAGQGKVMTMQLRQLESRGLNAAATLGKQMGKTEEEIRDMVQKGKISFKEFAEAMDAAYGEHAKEANSTFEGSMANLKSALSRIGQNFAAPIRSNMIGIFNTLKGIVNVLNKSKFTQIYKDFEDFASKASNFVQSVLKDIDLSFIDGFVDKLHTAYLWFDAIMTEVNPYWKGVEEGEKAAEKAVDNHTEALKDYEAVVQRVRNGEYGNGQERYDRLEKEGYNWKIVQNMVNEAEGSTKRYEVSEEELAAAKAETNNEVKKSIALESEGRQASRKAYTEWMKEQQRKAGVESNGRKASRAAYEEYAKQQSEIAKNNERMRSMKEIVDNLKVKLTPVAEGIASAFSIVANTFNAVVQGAIDPAMRIFSSLGNIILDVLGFLGLGVTSLEETAEETDAYGKIQQTVNDVLNTFADILETIESVVHDLTSGKSIGEAIKSLFGGDGEVEEAESTAETVGSTVSKIGEFAKMLGSYLFGDGTVSFGNLLSTVSELFPVLAKAVPLVMTGLGGLKAFRALRGLAGPLDTLRQTPRYLKSIIRGNNADAVLTFAKAIAVLAAAFYALSSLSWDQVAKGATAILTISAALAGLYIILNKFSRNKNEDSIASILGIDGYLSSMAANQNASSILKIAGAFAILSASLFLLAQLSWEDLGKAGLALVGITGAIAALFVLFKNTGTNAQLIRSPIDSFLISISGTFRKFMNKLGTTAIIAAVAAAIIAIGNIIIKLSEMPVLDALKAVGILGLIFIELYALVGDLVDLSKHVKGGAGSIALIMGTLALVISSIGKTMERLSKIDLLDGLKGVALLGLLMVELHLMMVGLTSLTSDTYGGGNVGLALIMATLARVIESLGSTMKDISAISWEDGFKGVVLMGAIIAELYLVMKGLTNLTADTKKGGNFGLALLMETLARVIESMGSTMKDLGSLSWEDGLKGITFMGLLLAELFLAVAGIASVAGDTEKGLLSISLLMIALASTAKSMSESLASLGDISWDDGVKALWLMGLLLGELFLAVVGMNSVAGDGKKGGLARVGILLIGLGAAIKLMSSGLAELASLEGKDLTAALAAITWLTVLVAALTLIGGSAKAGTASLKSVLPMLALLGGLTAALAIIANLPSENLVGATKALTKVVLSLSVAMLAMSKLGTKYEIEAKPILALIGVIAVVTGAMLLLANLATGDIGTVGSSLSKVLLAVSAMIAAMGIANFSSGHSSVGAAEMWLENILPIMAIIAEVMAGIAAVTLIVPDDKVATLEAISQAVTDILWAIDGLVAAMALLEGAKNISLLTAAHATGSWKTILIGAAILAVMAFVGWLDETLNPEEGKGILESAAKGLEAWKAPMKALGEAIGSLFGGFLGGVIFGLFGIDLEEWMRGFAESVEKLPQTLQTWADDLQKTFEHIKGLKWDNEGLDDFEEFVGHMKTVASGMYDIATSFFEMVNSKRVTYEGEASQNTMSVLVDNIELVTQFEQWARALTSFSSTLTGTGFNSEEVTQAIANAETVLGSFNTLLAEVVELDDISDVTQTINDIPLLATKLKEYSENIASIDKTAVTDTNDAVELIQAIAGKAIEQGALSEIKEGSLLWWMSSSETKLSKYAQDLPGLATGLAQYSENIKQLKPNVQVVAKTAFAAQIVNALAGSAITNAEGMTFTETQFGFISSLAAYSDSLGPFAEGLANFSQGLVSGGENGEGFNSGAVTAAKDAAEIVNALASAAPDVSFDTCFFGWVTGNKLEELGTGLGPLATGLTTFSKNIGEFDADNVRRYSNSIRFLLSSISQFIDQMTTLNDGEIAWADIDEALGNFDGFILKITGHFSDEYIDQKTDLTKLEAAAKSFGERMGSTFRDSFAEGFKNTVKTDNGMALDNGMWSPIQQGTIPMGDETSKIQSAVQTNLIDPIIDTISGALDTLYTSGVDVLGQILDGLNSDPASIMAAGLSIMTGLLSGMVSGGSAVTSRVRAMASNLATIVRNAQPQMRGAGLYLMMGLADGIRKGESGVISAMANVASDTIAKAKEEFDIKSPSHVFEDIGNYLMEGQSLGITKGLPMVMSAIDNASGAVVDRYEQSMDDVAAALGAAYLYINQVVQDSMNANPVITPVLDLSMMQNGLYAMNGMMPGSYGYNPLAYSMSAFPGSYSYGYSQQAMSQSNLEAELRGLRSDVKALGEAMSTMGITLDSGVMVGALTPGTDRELGNITKFKERWA